MLRNRCGSELRDTTAVSMSLTSSRPTWPARASGADSSSPAAAVATQDAIFISLEFPLDRRFPNFGRRLQALRCVSAGLAGADTPPPVGP